MGEVVKIGKHLLVYKLNPVLKIRSRRNFEDEAWRYCIFSSEDANFVEFVKEEVDAK